MPHYKAPDNSLHFIERDYAHLLPAGSVEISDAEADQIREQNKPPLTQEQINAEHLAYLASTDWYVIRFADSGVPVPDDIRVARQAARDAII